MKRIIELLLWGISGVIIQLLVVVLFYSIHRQVDGWWLMVILGFWVGILTRFYLGPGMGLEPEQIGQRNKNWPYIVILAWATIGEIISGIIIKDSWWIGFLIGAGFGGLSVFINFITKGKLIDRK